MKTCSIERNFTSVFSGYLERLCRTFVVQDGAVLQKLGLLSALHELASQPDRHLRINSTDFICTHLVFDGNGDGNVVRRIHERVG